MPDENLPPPDGDGTLPPPDIGDFGAGEIAHQTDEAGHLPYAPPTPSEAMRMFEGPAKEPDQPEIDMPDEPDPNVESVVPDLQPIVELTGTGEVVGDPAPRDTEPPPPQTPQETLSEELDESLALDEAAVEIGDILDPSKPVTTPPAQTPTGGPDVESVVGDLQPVVLTDQVNPTPDPPPAEISLETPAPDPAAGFSLPGRSWVRLPMGKPVYVWGVAVGIGAVGVAVAIALIGGGTSHPTATASAKTAPAATTSAAAAAPTTSEAAPPATPSLSLGSIGAVYTHRPPPKTDNQSCDPNAKVCLGLPLKSVEVRYTTYTVRASDRAGRKLTYRWSDSNSCGTFKPKGKSAIWDFSNYQGSTCPKGSIPQGTVSVVVSDGKDTCTARYPGGGTPGTGPKSQVCTGG